MSPDVNLDEIAKGTPGAVGADLANIVNEAALRAVKHKRDEVIQEDLQEAVEVIIAGKEKVILPCRFLSILIFLNA